MPPVSNPLTGIEQSVEALIVRSFFETIRADSRFNTRFNPIRLIELPNVLEVEEFHEWTMFVGVGVVRGEDHPSLRQTTNVPVVVGWILPWESTNADSELRALNVINLFRVFCWENASLKDTVSVPGQIITFATADMRRQSVNVNKERGVCSVPCSVWLQTDLNPKTGDLL